MMIDILLTLSIAATIGLAGARAGGILTLSIVAGAFVVQNGYLLAFESMAAIDALGAILAFNVGAGAALIFRPAAASGTA